MSTGINDLTLWQSAIISNALCMGSGPGRPKRYPYQIAPGHDAYTLSLRLELPCSISREEFQNRLEEAHTKTGVNGKDEWVKLSLPKRIIVIESATKHPGYETFCVTLEPELPQPLVQYFEKNSDYYDPELKKDI